MLCFIFFLESKTLKLDTNVDLRGLCCDFSHTNRLRKRRAIANGKIEVRRGDA